MNQSCLVGKIVGPPVSTSNPPNKINTPSLECLKHLELLEDIHRMGGTAVVLDAQFDLIGGIVVELTCCRCVGKP
jgi:hypothetical protein